MCKDYDHKVADNKRLQSRLEALELFVWQHLIADKCEHNGNGVCENFEDVEDFCRCEISACSNSIFGRICQACKHFVIAEPDNICLYYARDKAQKCCEGQCPLLSEVNIFKELR